MKGENYQPLLEWFNEEVEQYNSDIQKTRAMTDHGADSGRLNFALGEIHASKRLLDGARTAIVASGALTDEQLALFIGEGSSEEGNNE